MTTTFKTSDPKLAYRCRKAQRTGEQLALSIIERGQPMEVAGRILDVGLAAPPSAGNLVWQITVA